MGKQRLSDAKISKSMSHALRHEPWLYELELDEEGWIGIDWLLAALKEKGQAWARLTRSDILRVVENCDKQRHELDGEKIRARYGHSLPGRLKRTPAATPLHLWHGTPPKVAQSILAEGLKPMSRQYVHLSTDQATAVQVGSRRAERPTLLRINALAAHNDGGVKFYEGNEIVWLADEVPARFILIDVFTG